MSVNKAEQAYVFAAKNGNKKCFEELYKRYYQSVYAIAITSTRRKTDSETVLSRTFTKAWQNMDEFDESSDFGLWIRDIAREQSDKLIGEKSSAVALPQNDELSEYEIKDAMIPPAAAMNIIGEILGNGKNNPDVPLAEETPKPGHIDRMPNNNETGFPKNEVPTDPVRPNTGTAGSGVAGAAVKSTFPLGAKIALISAAAVLVGVGAFAAWNALKPSEEIPAETVPPTTIVQQQSTTVQTTTVKEESSGSEDSQKTIVDVDPDDLPESLTRFLQSFDFAYFSDNMSREFNCNDTDKIYDSFAERIVGNPTMVDLSQYPGGDIKKSFEQYSDPLGKYPKGWGYIAVPKKKTFWIMENVFNISEDDSTEIIKKKMNSNADFYEFEKDGVEYYCNKIGGLGGPGYSITFETVRYDGEKYYIVYECGDPAGFEGAGTVEYYAEMALKKTDDMEYWSLYRHTEDIPELPEPNDNGSDDEKEEEDNDNEGENTEDVFGMFAGKYAFTSGVGYWSTQMELKADGTFSGEYHDQNAGESGDGYDGTTYKSTFSGSFTNPKKLNDYTYSFELGDIKYENTPGTEEIESMGNSDFKMRMAYTEAYGLDRGTKTIYAYTPDAPVSELPEGFMSWVGHLRSDETRNNSELSYKCLYVVEPEYGWIGGSE